MKATRKLIPALAMLIVATVVMSTASYAWFTMSKQVTASGMNVTVTAPNNLLISADNSANSYAASADLAASDYYVLPASSISGANDSFFTLIDSVAGNGSRIASSKFNAAAAGTTATGSDNAGAYVDFTYYLKTDGEETVNVGLKDIVLTDKDGKEVGASGAAAGLTAVRFAIVNGVENGTSTSVMQSDSTVWSPAGASNFVANKAIATVQADNTVVDATDLATVKDITLDDATDITTGNIFTVAKDKITRVVIRVWLEGEDQNCIADNAALMEFNLQLTLVDVASTKS